MGLENSYDVIVVGGGPAGCCSAIMSVRKGLKTALFERERMPRIKPCGGLLSRKALKELPIELPESMIRNVITRIKMVSHSGRVSESCRRASLGVTVERWEFDEFFLDCARGEGVEVFDSCPVISVESGGPVRPVLVETSRGAFSTSVLVGADGVSGITAGEAGIRSAWRRWDLGLTVSAELPYELPGMKSDHIGRDFMGLYSNGLPFGWGWMIPCGEKVNIGVGSSVLGSRRLMGEFSKLIANIFHGRVEVAGGGVRPRGSCLPCGGMKRRLGRDRVILAGDAAGFVEPFSGEGIFCALRSARLAADSAAEFIRGGCQESLEELYADSCGLHLEPFLRQSLFLSLLVPVKKISMDALAICRPDTVERIADIMEGEGAYSSALKEFARGLPLAIARLAVKKRLYSD